MFRLFFLAVVLLIQVNAYSHDLGDGAHITTIFNDDGEPPQWTLEITMQDLLSEFSHFDVNENGRLTPMEYGNVNAREVAEYVQKRLQVKSDGSDCQLHIERFNIVTHKRADYLQFPLLVACHGPGSLLSVEYHLFFDQNPYHQGTWTVILKNQPTMYYFWEDQRLRQFQIRPMSWWQTAYDFLAKGVYHILIGYDHLLFLISLLLPAALVRKGKQWVAVNTFKPAFWYVVKIVTAFTLAHTITLMCAVMGWVPLPASWLVESVIAFSIIVMAINNIKPWLTKGIMTITFLFGLIHGFGFASVLMEYPLPQGAIAVSLIFFNLGVELGQLVVVTLAFPLIYYVRNRSGYSRYVMPLVSVVVCMVAGYWLVERLMLM